VQKYHIDLTLRCIRRFRNSQLCQLCCPKIKEAWGHKVCRLVVGYDQDVLVDSILVKLQNGLSYYDESFHCPASVELLGLDCKVEYTNANEGIMPQSHNIGVQYTESDLDKTFQGRVRYFALSYFRWTTLNQILEVQEHLPGGKTISSFSTRCKKTQQWILISEM